MTELRDAVLRHVNDPRYRPVKPKVIAKKLGVAPEGLPLVKKTIKKLVKKGELAYGPNHLVCAASSAPTPGTPTADLAQTPTPAAPDADMPTPGKGKGKHVLGIFRRNASGFGFVRPQGTSPSTGRDADIFISAQNTSDASSGDLVRIRLSGKKGRLGKPEGRIIDVVERATNRFVGVYFEEVGVGMVQIDGNVFTRPISVGDPGAKGVRTDDKVVLEMVQFPSHAHDGEAVIVEVLGGRGQPGVDTLSIIHEFDLPGEFAEDALEEARRQAKQFDEAISPTPLGAPRVDLTGETVITIDPATARDFDDAISLTQRENGHLLLGVHIADVSHFVQPKSPLDREAFDRATSVYLPDRVIPMLPEVISNNLASLQPHRIRYALTAQIEFTPAGIPVATEFFKSAIKSCRRFTYEEVDAWIARQGAKGAKGAKKKVPPASPRPKTKAVGKIPAKVDQLLGRMYALAMTLRKRRFARGALELSMPEIEIDLDAEGRVSGAHLEENTQSHQIIEEFMLAANEAVARQLADQGLAFLRRVHGAPDPRKLKALTAFVKELGIQTESLENRFALQKLLDDVQGDPRQHAVNYAVLRSMQRAVYSPEDEGHYALASDCYCHFTSPIRRYPDLTIHRLIEDVLVKKPPQQQLETLFAQGDHCSEREQRATSAERELTKVKLLNHLSDKVGLEMDGVVTGVESFGMFVTGTQLPVEGFIHMTALTDDYYRYEREGHVLQGLRTGNSYRLGDPLRVVVAAVDVDRRQLDFRLVGRPAAGTQKKEGSQPRGSSRGPTQRGKGRGAKSASRARPPKKGGKKRR
jgi:ribonuclease R